MTDLLYASGRTRRLALAVAGLALVSLAVQIIVDWLTSGGLSLLEQLWKSYRFFTIITNTMVLGLAGWVAATGRWPGAALPAAVTVWILAVGIVYHILLAPTHDPRGLLAWSNQGLHTVVPALYAALWLSSAPRVRLGYHQPVVWTAFPLGYVGYAFARGQADGIYPYFFLDPGRVGPWGMAGYVLGLGAAFVIAGLGIVAIARRRG